MYRKSCLVAAVIPTQLSWNWSFSCVMTISSQVGWTPSAVVTELLNLHVGSVDNLPRIDLLVCKNRPCKHWNPRAYRFQNRIPATVCHKCSNGLMCKNLWLRSPTKKQHGTSANSLLKPYIAGRKYKLDHFT